MLASDSPEDESKLAGPDLAEKAFTVLYNTDRLMRGRQDHAKTLFSTDPPDPMLSDEDEGLSRVVGAGPRLARMSDDALAERSTGPMLAQYSGPGPALAQADTGGPALEGQDQAPAAPQASPGEWSSSQRELYNEVQELRDMVDQLRKEAEAREHLRLTEDEERDEEAEILQAAGREYSIRPPWQFQLDLRTNYSYNDYDVIRQMRGREGVNIEHVANHRITNNFSLETGIRDNLSIDASVPFVYVYDKVGQEDSRDTTNLGDISVGLKFQPLKTGRGYPSPIFSVDYTFPTGKSPYDINPATELSTGSGFHQVSGRASISQPFDPVNAFASISYRHRFKETGIGQARSRGILDEVDPGEQISVSLGFGYAVSYRMSMSMSVGASYTYSTDYYWLERDRREKTRSGDSVSASLNLNTSWRVTPRRTVVIGFGKGLTTAHPGFTLSARVPFTMDLR